MLIKVLLAALAAILTLVLIFVLGNRLAFIKNMKLARSFSAVEPLNKALLQREKDGSYFFYANDDFSVLQLTDLHLGSGIFSFRADRKAINAIASMVTAQRPNLVAVTGDIAFPVPHYSGTLNNKAAHKIMAELMESLGVLWIPVFGNHDTEVYSRLTREKTGNLYESKAYPHCLFKSGREDIDGCGNSVINIKNSCGIITQSLVFLDSHSYTADNKFGIKRKYDCIKDSQVDWYREETEKNIKYNKRIIGCMELENKEAESDLNKKYCEGNSLVFFHIPIKEYKTAYEEYLKGSDDAFLLYGRYGEKNCDVHFPFSDSKLFETAQGFGGRIGFFCGHDHLNNASLMYKGIQLTYGYSIDYFVYFGIGKYGLYRGCTQIDIKNDSSFKVQGLNYYDERFKPLNGYEKEKVSMQPYFKN